MSVIEGRCGILPARHVDDLLPAGLKVVFCGTALGRKSAEARAYYAHPGNRFWRTLHDVGLTPHRLAPDEWRDLAHYGIGLTDVCKTHYGNDADLPADAFDAAALTVRIGEASPGLLAFTSKKAASQVIGRPTGRIAYGLQSERIYGTPLFVLESPSGSASRYWNGGATWRALAHYLAANEPASLRDGAYDAPGAPL